MSESETQMVNVAVVGLGFIGQVHFQAYERAVRDGYPCRVAAVCDQSEERRSGRLADVGNLDEAGSSSSEQLFNPADLSVYSDFSDVLADDSVHLVSICTHTDTHRKFATQALEAGKHVLLEKPVDIHAAGVRSVVDAARAHPRQVIMPAMCMRFWPGWTWLKEAVSNRTYGRVNSAVFRRLGCGPGWAREFYHDLSRSGGAMVDLHIHDVDFINHLFGVPIDVFSTGDPLHVTTLYRYDRDAGAPMHVTAEGGWHNAPSVPFDMSFAIQFEEAVAKFDLNAEHALMLYEGDNAIPIDLPDVSGYEGEVRHIIDLITGCAKTPVATIDDALTVATILDAERASLESHSPQRPTA